MSQQTLFFSYLVAKKLSPDEYAMLYSISKGLVIDPSLSVDLNKLHSRNFLIKTEKGWKPTQSTKSIIKYTDTLFNEAKGDDKKYDQNRLSDLADAILNRYPKESPKNGNLLCSKADLLRKLRIFFNKYDYTMEHVAGGFKLYIRYHESINDYTYMKKLTNFIMIRQDSELSAWCERFLKEGV